MWQSRLLDEDENQAHNCQCLDLCDAQEQHGLQGLLGLGLTSNAVHLCREDQTHADAAANSCQTVANRSDGTNHYFSFQQCSTGNIPGPNRV